MEKIKIKLKECCLTCEHFDPSGIKGIVYPVVCCGELERVIACGHMEVCCKYLGCEAANVVRCGECRRWHPDGTYGVDLDGEKQQYGTCDMTQTACKENHFCSYGRKNG